MRAWRAIAVATEGHRADLAGLAAIAVGLIAGLGIYAGLAGPFGRLAASGAAELVGVAKVMLPPVLVAAGVLMIRGRDDQREPNPRLAVGGVLVVLAVLGLIHLGRYGGEVARADAAGVVGSLVGRPLEAVLGPWGAALVLGAAVITGLLVLTGGSLQAVAGQTVTGLRPAVAAGRRGFESLFRVGEEPEYDEEEDEVTSSFYDQDADDDAVADAAGRGRRGRKPTIVLPPDPVADPEPDGEPEQLEIELPPGARRSAWKLPQTKLLHRVAGHAVDRATIEETGRGLEHALSEHGVETRLVGMTVGPTVTRYELELGPGVKVARVTSLHKDIAYAMATPDVRILAPIPGKQAIGIEIPNVRKQLVTVGDILASPEARAAHHPLEVAIGRDIDGKAVMADLAGMPHLLIAGATGAGKSSCLNSLITSVLMRSTPDQVRMILIDPKRVEMGQYNRLPHLLTEVVINPKKAANALAWAVKEMERRYDLLAEVGFRDVTGYNAAFDRGELVPEPGSDREYPRLPFIMVVVDELADLMMVAARDVEDSICRLAQMARAVGIHLVIATQRPSVNVITGLIKANIPARLAFAVSSVTDSRVILDQAGAERLLGRGDMLLLGPASSAPMRIQGSWVTEEEVRAIVGHWRRQAPEIEYDDHVQGAEDMAAAGGFARGDADGGDPLLEEAMELVVRSQFGSTSMLQRKLGVGFARAGRIMDLLEQRGVVGPTEGSKARAVLMTSAELDGTHEPDPVEDEEQVPERVE